MGEGLSIQTAGPDWNRGTPTGQRTANGCIAERCAARYFYSSRGRRWRYKQDRETPGVRQTPARARAHRERASRVILGARHRDRQSGHLKGKALRTLSRRGPPVRIRSRALNEFSNEVRKRVREQERIRILQVAALERSESDRLAPVRIRPRAFSANNFVSGECSQRIRGPEDERSEVLAVRIRSRECFSE